MQGTLILKSDFIYTVDILNIAMSNGSNSFPLSGTLRLPEQAIKQLDEDAKTFGNWRAIKEMRLSVRVDENQYQLDILINELPFQPKVSFETINVETKT